MTAPDPLRVYLDPAEIGGDGYPYAWHSPQGVEEFVPAIKDLVRERDGHRCLRCRHPYEKGSESNSPRSEWTICDDQCRHSGPIQVHPTIDRIPGEAAVQAQWRILTVHHLNGIKHDCTWGNLVSLCQKCHLSVQQRVVMSKVWDKPHSDWFRPFAAFHYARVYLGEDLSREEVDERMEELLALELRQEALPGA